MYHDRWRSSQPDKIHPGQLSSLILSERIPNSKRATCWNALPWVISEMVPPYKVFPIPIQSNSNAPNVHCVCDAKFSHEFNFAKLQPEWVSESMSWCDATLSGEGITGDCSQGRVRECSLTLPCSSSWHRQTRGLEHDLETEGGVGCNDQHFDHLKNICWYYYYYFLLSCYAKVISAVRLYQKVFSIFEILILYWYFAKFIIDYWKNIYNERCNLGRLNITTFTMWFHLDLDWKRDITPKKL